MSALFAKFVVEFPPSLYSESEILQGAQIRATIYQRLHTQNVFIEEAAAKLGGDSVGKLVRHECPLGFSSAAQFGEFMSDVEWYVQHTAILVAFNC